MSDLLYFRLSDDDLLVAAQMEDLAADLIGHSAIDPRIWNEARRRGIEGRLAAILARARAEGEKLK